MSVKVHEPVCLDSGQDLYFWFDHFLGDQVKDEWRVAGTGTGVVVDAQTGGIIRFTTGATTNDALTLDWTDIRSLHVTKKVTMEFRLKLNHITYIDVDLNLRFNVSNRIRFHATENAGGATTWYIACRNVAQTSLNTGINIDTDYHIFRIEAFPTDEVHFYIDGTEVTNSPIITNIPDDAADFLQPWFYLQTLEDAAKSMDIDYVVVRQER